MPRLAKPSSCSTCLGWDWSPKHDGFIPASGHGTSGLMMVGEAGGRSEGNEGRAFVEYAQSGSLLEKALRLLGSSRQQHRLTNILHCSPPRDHLVDTSYEFDVIQSCRHFLDSEIDAMTPRAILALGGTALRELTGLVGKNRGVSYLRGYTIPLSGGTTTIRRQCNDCKGDGTPCFLCDGTGYWEETGAPAPDPRNIPVIATFHPSFIRQGKPGYFSVLLHDLKTALEVARVGVRPPMSTRYQLHPSLQDAWSFLQRVRDNRSQWLTYDIETPLSADMDEDERDEDNSAVITQIQFSLAPGEGIVFPAQPDYMELARMIIAEPNPKAGHNSWLFDDPKMAANGFVFGGPFPHDTMQMWHHMQPDLAANLQFVASFYGMDKPWKHLSGLDMAEYGAADVDAPQRILQKLPADLRRRGLWEGYERRVYQLRPILAKMEKLGVPINDHRRLEFRDVLTAQMVEENNRMQELVPEECRNLHPKRGYKKVPKDTTGLVLRKFEDTRHPSEFADKVGTLDLGLVERWCRIEPFTPSPKQLLTYMRFRGHPIPRHYKTGRDTTDAKELERLERSTGDILYRRVRQYREIQTMKGTFVDGWVPSADGRVHTTFTFQPATAQLSSRDPNVQNSPQHTKLAERFQEVIEAPPGYKLVSFDHKSFHALTLGFLAEDEDYIRISRIDLHSFVASEFLRLKPASTMMVMPSDELAEYLGWVKQQHQHVRDYKCKRVDLGWQYGRGYRSVYQAYREDFTGETEAKRLLETLEGCFPKAVLYRAKTLHEADRPPNCLTTPFGFVRWFWDVLDYRPPADGTRRRGAIRKCGICGLHHSNGEQAEQAIAYRPACCAFGMMREEALDMDANGYTDRFGQFNNIHDAWKFCCPDELVEECVHTIQPLMEKPTPYMKHPTLAPDGLWCAVETKVGQSEATMHKVKGVGHVVTF